MKLIQQLFSKQKQYGALQAEDFISLLLQQNESHIVADYLVKMTQFGKNNNFNISAIIENIIKNDNKLTYQYYIENIKFLQAIEMKQYDEVLLKLIFITLIEEKQLKTFLQQIMNEKQIKEHYHPNCLLLDQEKMNQIIEFSIQFQNKGYDDKHFNNILIQDHLNYQQFETPNDQYYLDLSQIPELIQNIYQSNQQNNSIMISTNQQLGGLLVKMNKLLCYQIIDDNIIKIVQQLEQINQILQTSQDQTTEIQYTNKYLQQYVSVQFNTNINTIIEKLNKFIYCLKQFGINQEQDYIVQTDLHYFQILFMFQRYLLSNLDVFHIFILFKLNIINKIDQDQNKYFQQLFASRKQNQEYIFNYEKNTIYVYLQLKQQIEQFLKQKVNKLIINVHEVCGIFDIQLKQYVYYQLQQSENSNNQMQQQKQQINKYVVINNIIYQQFKLFLQTKQIHYLFRTITIINSCLSVKIKTQPIMQQIVNDAQNRSFTNIVSNIKNIMNSKVSSLFDVLQISLLDLNKSEDQVDQQSVLVINKTLENKNIQKTNVDLLNFYSLSIICIEQGTFRKIFQILQQYILDNGNDTIQIDYLRYQQNIEFLIKLMQSFKIENELKQKMSTQIEMYNEKKLAVMRVQYLINEFYLNKDWQYLQNCEYYNQLENVDISLLINSEQLLQIQFDNIDIKTIISKQYVYIDEALKQYLAISQLELDENKLQHISHLLNTIFLASFYLEQDYLEIFSQLFLQYTDVENNKVNINEKYKSGLLYLNKLILSSMLDKQQQSLIIIRFIVYFNVIKQFFEFIQQEINSNILYYLQFCYQGSMIINMEYIIQQIQIQQIICENCEYINSETQQYIVNKQMKTKQQQYQSDELLNVNVSKNQESKILIDSFINSSKVITLQQNLENMKQFLFQFVQLFQNNTKIFQNYYKTFINFIIRFKFDETTLKNIDILSQILELTSYKFSNSVTQEICILYLIIDLLDKQQLYLFLKYVCMQENVIKEVYEDDNCFCNINDYQSLINLSSVQITLFDIIKLYTKENTHNIVSQLIDQINNNDYINIVKTTSNTFQVSEKKWKMFYNLIQQLNDNQIIESSTQFKSIFGSTQQNIMIIRWVLFNTKIFQQFVYMLQNIELNSDNIQFKKQMTEMFNLENVVFDIVEWNKLYQVIKNKNKPLIIYSQQIAIPVIQNYEQYILKESKLYEELTQQSTKQIFFTTLNNMLFQEVSAFISTHDYFYFHKSIHLIVYLLHHIQNTNSIFKDLVHSQIDQIQAIIDQKLQNCEYTDYDYCFVIEAVKNKIFEKIVNYMFQKLKSSSVNYPQSNAYANQIPNILFIRYVARELQKLDLNNQQSLENPQIIQKMHIEMLITDFVYNNNEYMFSQTLLQLKNQIKIDSIRLEFTQLQEPSKYQRQQNEQFEINTILHSQNVNEEDIESITVFMINLFDDGILDDTKCNLLLYANEFISSQVDNTEQDNIILIDDVMQQMDADDDKQVVFIRGLIIYNVLKQFFTFVESCVTQQKFLQLYYQQARLLNFDYNHIISQLHVMFICNDNAKLLHNSKQYQLKQKIQQQQTEIPILDDVLQQSEEQQEQSEFVMEIKADNAVIQQDQLTIQQVVNECDHQNQNIDKQEIKNDISKTNQQSELHSQNISQKSNNTQSNNVVDSNDSTEDFNFETEELQPSIKEKQQKAIQNKKINYKIPQLLYNPQQFENLYLNDEIVNVIIEKTIENHHEIYVYTVDNYYDLEDLEITEIYQLENQQNNKLVKAQYSMNNNINITQLVPKFAQQNLNKQMNNQHNVTNFNNDHEACALCGQDIADISTYKPLPNIEDTDSEQNYIINSQENIFCQYYNRTFCGTCVQLRYFIENVVQQESVIELNVSSIALTEIHYNYYKILNFESTCNQNLTNNLIHKQILTNNIIKIKNCKYLQQIINIICAKGIETLFILSQFSQIEIMQPQYFIKLINQQINSLLVQLYQFLDKNLKKIQKLGVNNILMYNYNLLKSIYLNGQKSYTILQNQNQLLQLLLTEHILTNKCQECNQYNKQLYSCQCCFKHITVDYNLENIVNMYINKSKSNIMICSWCMLPFHKLCLNGDVCTNCLRHLELLK